MDTPIIHQYQTEEKNDDELLESLRGVMHTLSGEATVKITLPPFCKGV